MLCCFFDPLDMLTIECSWILASLGFSLGASKFPYNEALHFRSSVLGNHDDIAKGIGFLFFFLGFPLSFMVLAHFFSLACLVLLFYLCTFFFLLLIWYSGHCVDTQFSVVYARFQDLIKWSNAILDLSLWYKLRS